MKRENALFYIWQAALALPLTGYMWSGTHPAFSCSETAASALFLFSMAAVLGLLLVITGRSDWVFRSFGNQAQTENAAAGTDIAAFGRRSWLLQFFAFTLAAVLYFCYAFPLDEWVDAVRPSWMSSKILDSLTAGGLFCIAALLPARRRIA